MGYSCTAAAGDTLEKIKKMLPSHSNYWEKDGKSYFLEIGRENNDGAVTGQIFASKGENTQCKRAGTFRIEPDGTISRFPHLPKGVK